MPEYTLEHNHKKGFTMIEILIVVMIIGLLSTIIFSAFGGSLARGRDAKRRGDMQALQKATELYPSANGTYPVADVESSLGEYLSGSFPVDPQTGDYVLYSNDTEFCFAAQLEDSTASPGNCGGCNDFPISTISGNTHYCVTNQQ